MARKIALNQNMREKLTRYIMREVQAPALRAAEDRARFLLSIEANRFILGLYPQDEMAVLKKYGAATDFKRLYVRTNDAIGENWDHWTSFELLHEFGTERLDIVLAPNQRGDLVCEADAAHPVIKGYAGLRALTKSRKDEEERIQSAYQKLVRETRYLDDLVQVWPEAAEVLKRKLYEEPAMAEAADIVKQNLCERGKLECRGQNRFPFVLGLSGKIGSGKTTIAGLVQEHFQDMDVRVLRTNFGDALKTGVAETYVFEVERCYTVEGKESLVTLSPARVGVEAGALEPGVLSPAWADKEYVTVRELLQHYGTEYARAKSPDYWVHAVNRQILEWCEASDAAEPRPVDKVVIIDDIRFPNEKAYVDDHGLCVRINPYPGWSPGPNADHISETGLDTACFEVVLTPDFGARFLQDAAQTIMHDLSKRELLTPAV